MSRFTKIFVFLAVATLTAGVGVGVDVANAAGQINPPGTKYKPITNLPCPSCDYLTCKC